jgi:hypothetical protein
MVLLVKVDQDFLMVAAAVLVKQEEQTVKDMEEMVDSIVNLVEGLLPVSMLAAAAAELEIILEEMVAAATDRMVQLPVALE